MRLFIAICFDEAVVDGLWSAVETLRSHGARGRFTRRENLHLTLAFLGETDHRADLVRILNGVQGQAFDMTLAGLGRFRRDGGDLVYLHADGGDALAALQGRLSRALRDAGFALEDRAFRPHLTLGREVLLPEGTALPAVAAALPPIHARVTSLVLMHSHRVEGRLVYTPLHRRTLG